MTGFNLTLAAGAKAYSINKTQLLSNGTSSIESEIPAFGGTAFHLVFEMGYVF